MDLLPVKPTTPPAFRISICVISPVLHSVLYCKCHVWPVSVSCDTEFTPKQSDVHQINQSTPETVAWSIPRLTSYTSQNTRCVLLFWTVNFRGKYAYIQANHCSRNMDPSSHANASIVTPSVLPLAWSCLTGHAEFLTLHQASMINTDLMLAPFTGRIRPLYMVSGSSLTPCPAVRSHLSGIRLWLHPRSFATAYGG